MRRKSSAGWQTAFENLQALFIHSGNPCQAHVQLRSGLHSSGFFNSRPVIEKDKLLKDAAWDLLTNFENQGGDLYEIDGVVGPQTGATKLAEFLASNLESSTGRPCFHASPAKHEENRVKSMVFTAQEIRMLKGQKILLVEDVLTTGGSIELTIKAIIESGGIILPYVLVLVNRSGLSQVLGKNIVSLINRSLPTWKAEDCPLCKSGSPAIENPKDNWHKLKA